MREHGKWSDPGVPHRGWVCIAFEDLDEPSEICEMCEVAEIRYVHIMRHAEYAELLRCGCVCAEHMEGDYVTPRQRESNAKNVATRRANWLTRRWKISEGGNEYLRTDGFMIVIYPLQSVEENWGAMIVDNVTGNRKYSKRRYPTSDDVKLAAFDAMVKLKERWRSSVAEE